LVIGKHIRLSQQSLTTRALVFYGSRLPDHPRKWWLHDRLRKWLAVQVADRESRVKRRGLWWSLNPADHAHAGLFWMGAKYTWEMHHLRRLLQPGCVVLDVGANYGYCAVTLAAALKQQCRFFAIEPDAENFARLKRHVEWNGLQDVVACHELAVSDVPGKGAMEKPAGNSGHARIVAEVADGKVEVTTLDAFVEAQGLGRLDALLLDVEGYEDRALRGAAKTLDRYRPLVVVELWPPAMHQQGSNVEAVANVLKEYGYRLFHPHRRQLLPLADLPTGDTGIYAFCIHKDRAPAALAS
jgi:FkbM family methyltransferase